MTGWESQPPRQGYRPEPQPHTAGEPPPQQSGWYDLYRRLHYLEWGNNALNERIVLLSQDIRRLQEELRVQEKAANERLETYQAEVKAIALRIAFGIMGTLLSLGGKAVWDLLMRGKA